MIFDGIRILNYDQVGISEAYLFKWKVQTTHTTYYPGFFENYLSDYFGQKDEKIIRRGTPIF